MAPAPSLAGTVWSALAAATLLVVLAPSASGHNYLLLHPFYSGSHVLTLHTVTQQLIARGHRVTTVRFEDPHGLTLKPAGPNHTEIVLNLNNSDGALPFVTRHEKGVFHMPLDVMWSEGLAIMTVFRVPGNPWTVVKAYCEQFIANEALISRLRDERFDVAIVDLIYNECGLALAHKLGVPSVGYWAFSFSSGEAELSTAATPASHIPAFMTELTHEMTFAQRVKNVAYKIFARCFMWYQTYVCDSALRKFEPDMPSTAQLLSDLNGALINSNNVLDYPRLQPETFVNIGGMQVSKKPNPLPKDILDWLEGAEHGVMLFSMGFIFNPSVMPKTRVDAIFNAFARLPQRVIVKYEGPAMENVPPNVMVKSFIPQQDILAHPKTILFFTHCGMHGVMEGIYHRVPMVGMPVFADQGDVLVRMEERGIGLGVSKKASSDEIYDAIVRVRDDKRFKENVDALSDLFRKQRNHPMDDALWLLEYVADTKGADHLKLSSRHLNLLQYHCIDVIAFLVVTHIVAFAVFKRLLASLRRRGSDNVADKKKTRNKRD